VQAASAAYTAQVAGASQPAAFLVAFDWLRASEGPYYSDDTQNFENSIGSWAPAGSNPPALATSIGGTSVLGAAHLAITLPTSVGGSVPVAVYPGPLLRPLLPGQVYTASVCVSVPAGVLPFDWFINGAASRISEFTTTTVNDQYQLLYVTFVAGAADNFPTLSPAGSTTAGQVVSVDAFRFYRGPLRPPFGPGLAFTPAPCSSITVERSISSDLDPRVTLISGTAAAVATLELTGNPADNTETAGWLYSPYQAQGELADVDMEGTPSTVQLGQQVAGAPELFTQIVGTVRVMDVSAAADGTSASVQLLDGRERFRPTPVLPQAVFNDPVIPPSGLPQRPGGDVQWVVDQIARQAGYYASPPTRAQALVAATLHGSAWPDVGTLTTSYYWDSVSTSTAFPVRFSQANFALGMEEQATDLALPLNFAQWSFSQRNQNNGDTMFYEGWHFLTPTLNDDLGAVYETAGVTRRIFFRMDGTGKLGLHWSRNGAAFADSFPAVAQVSTPGWYYVAWHITYDSPNTTIRIRVGATLDTITTATPSTFTGSAVGMLAVFNHGNEAVQLTSEPYSSTMFNHLFVPNSVLEPGLSELVAMPPLSADTDGWTVVQEIAKCTAGAAMVNEVDIFQFWNRRHWGTAPAATTVQRVIRAKVPLKSVVVQRLSDRIRNIIRVPVSPLQITTAAVIWSLTELIQIGAGKTVTRFVDLSPNQGYQIDTATGVIPSGGALVNGHSGYRASRRQDGTAGEVTNIVMAVTPFASSVKITWTNTNTFPVWLVTPSSGYPAASVGQPTAALVGRLVTAAATAPDTGADVGSTTVLVEYRDESSITDNGERPLTLDASVWLQNSDDGGELAQEIGFATSRAYPQLSSVTIAADPALQLGDLVLIDDDSDDVTGDPRDHPLTGILDPFWVVGITNRQTDDEAVQDLVLRPVAPPRGILTAEMAGTSQALAERSTLDGRWRAA
jgi:hypothetical protein